MLSGTQIDEGEKQHPLKGKRRVDLFQSGIHKVARAETLTLGDAKYTIRDGVFKWSEEWANGVES